LQLWCLLVTMDYRAEGIFELVIIIFFRSFMMNEAATGILQQDKETIISIIHAVLPKCKIYLFGSRAQGKQDVGSDIDIAVDTGAFIDREKIYLIKERLEETIIPQRVDVVDLHSASDVLKEQVMTKGIVWKD